MATRSAAVNIAALALGVLLSPAFAAAQTSFGALGGKVTDEQGAFLPGATIVVRHLETNTTRSGTTEARGQYFLDGSGCKATSRSPRSSRSGSNR